MKYCNLICKWHSVAKNKVLITMKLTLIFSVIFFFQASANLLAQKRITINETNATLEAVLNKISKQTKFDVIYNSNVLIKSKPITIKAENELLTNVLSKCFEGLPIEFKIESTTIVIKDKKADKIPAISSRRAGYKLTGIVRDELDHPFVGVSIKVVGTNKVAVTGADGKFSIEVEPTDVLQFVFIGYKTQNISVKNQSDLLVKMEPEAGSLNEVAVVGFGKQKKVSVVGALTTIKPEDLRIPSSNLSNALAGKLAGVVAFQRSGEPGADGATFYIRGISTFSGATNPLIILDGVAVSSGDLNALAPEVIESFSILKDATATAIYCSRGANGVMIVTTKSGKDLDKPRINVRIENSISTPNVTPSMATCFLQEPNEGPLANLFDNNLSTYFHSAYSVASVGPHYVTVTFPEETTLGQVKFFNRQGRGTNTDGRPTSISLSTSTDGTNWSTAWTSGTLPTPPDVEVSSTFDKPYTSKRFRVSFLATARSSVYVALAEMSFYKADLTDLEVQAEQSY